MPEQEQQNRQIKREVARIASIEEVLQGEYIVQEGWKPNYVLLPRGDHASRVNIIGTVVDVEKDSDGEVVGASMDDGTSTIKLRSFEDNSVIEKVRLGKQVLLIGRPRIYGNETYLFPEIVRPVDNPLWIKVRKLELQELSKDAPPVEKEPEPEKPAPEEKKGNDDGSPEEIDLEESSESDDMLALIKKLDSGDGADTEDVIKDSRKDNAQKIIDSLLKMGDVFEVAGKLKVLE